MFNNNTFQVSLTILSQSINSAEEFKQLMLDWITCKISLTVDGDGAGLDAFVEWTHEESEKWLSFEQWETFCIENNMA